MGVSLYTAFLLCTNLPPQLDLKLKSAPFQFGNGVLQDRQLVAGGCLAGCWPGVWLAGHSLAHQLAGWLIVERVNMLID